MYGVSILPSKFKIFVMTIFFITILPYRGYNLKQEEQIDTSN